MMMNKKLAVVLTIVAFGLAQVAPVAAQTSSNKPAQTSPKKNTTAKKKATPKKSTAPKKKTTKTTKSSKPKTSSLISPQVLG
jgi:hypothetical protein